MIQLSVNVNKIALLRNSRGGRRPDLLDAARDCIDTGCHGITVHPRPDERHTRRRDVHDLARMLREEYPHVEFNVEGSPAPEWLDLVCAVQPTQATLVPDAPDQLTSDHGFDLLSGGYDDLPDVVQRLKSYGIRVSLFLDPDANQVAPAATIGCDRIELYTEKYAAAFGTAEQSEVFSQYEVTARRAAEAGLGVNAGHDLDLQNLTFLARHLPELQEVSIGHALVCDALERGLTATVRAYLDALVAPWPENG